jgi:hypothetical protein
MRMIHQEWHELRTSLASWQQEGEGHTQHVESLRDGMEPLHGAAIARDEYVDLVLNKHQVRLDRQRRNMSANYQRIVELREEVAKQKVLIESMLDRLCNCRSVPIPNRSSGRSSGLSYVWSEEYWTPPASTLPRENNTPLPVAVVESDLENIDPNDVVPIYASTHESVEAALAQDCLVDSLWVPRKTRLQQAVKSVPLRRNPLTIHLGVPVGYHLEDDDEILMGCVEGSTPVMRPTWSPEAMELGPLLMESQWTERVVTSLPDGHFRGIQAHLIEERLGMASLWRVDAWVPSLVRLSSEEGKRLLSQLMTDRAKSPP